MIGRYEAYTLEEDGVQTVRLVDADTQSEAAIAISVGSNLYRFTTFAESIILPPPKLSHFTESATAPFQYGTPLLFPPNRVKNATFTHNGTTYELPANDGENHLHGELCSRAWQVLQYGASDEEGAYVTSQFKFSDHADLLAYFPHELTFTITHRLQDGQLELSGTIVNEGRDEAPFAFGLHPYFSLPLDQGSDEEINCTIHAKEEWPVTSEAFVTGMPEKTEFIAQLRKGIDLASYPVLGCSMVTLEDGASHCKLRLKNKRMTIHYALDEAFPYVVLFRPDWANGFSIEPYSAITDAFNVPYASEWTGARGIEAGEQVTFMTKLWIEKE